MDARALNCYLRESSRGAAILGGYVGSGLAPALGGRLLTLLVLVSGFLIPAVAFAAGGKPQTKLVQVVDTRDMAPGVARWLADLYNTNLWLYGLVVVVTMCGIGLVLGLIFDRLVGLLKIDLGKLDHHE